MTTCPKCKQPIKIFDWKPQCPHCGVNLMLYGFEEKFYEDAKLTEMGNARVRVWFTGVKTALIGGKLQIIRLVFCLLPVIALLLPYADFNFSLPLYSGSFSLGLLGLINSFSNGVLNAVFELKNAGLVGAAVTSVFVATLAFAAVMLCAVLGVVFEILCFIKIKAMSKIMCVVSALGVIASAVTCFLSVTAVNTANDCFVFSAKNGFGVCAAVAAFLLVFIVNAIAVKKGIPVTYKEGDLLRIETARRLRRKEITLDDIPFPIFETEQEKEARESAIKATLEHTNAVAVSQTKDGEKSE